MSIETDLDRDPDLGTVLDLDRDLDLGLDPDLDTALDLDTDPDLDTDTDPGTEGRAKNRLRRYVRLKFSIIAWEESPCSP